MQKQVLEFLHSPRWSLLDRLAWWVTRPRT